MFYFIAASCQYSHMYVYCYTFPGFQDEMEEARTATQNALLKQLLATSLAMGGARPAGTPFSEVCCLFC